MEILIFSDSHGRVEGMQRALDRQPKRPDLILHLGDGAGDLEYLHCRFRHIFTVFLPIKVCFFYCFMPNHIASGGISVG